MALAGMAVVGVAVLYIRQAEVAPGLDDAPPARRLAPGTLLGWTAEDHGSPARYRVGEWRLELSSRDHEFGAMTRLTVRAPGAPPITMEGDGAAGNAEVGVGQLDGEGAPELIFTSFSGGAHCCTQIHVLQLDEGRWRTIDLGHWDDDPLEAWPTSIDGDDRADLVLSDDAFLYAFASYAYSFSPAQIFNIQGGRAVDVSPSPRYRAVHASDLAKAREACESGNNGACAAYAASAAPLGEFESAWRFVLQHHDPNSGWDFPEGCRVTVVRGECPPASTISFTTFPEALRWFLGENGYIEPQTPSGPA